MKMVVLMCVEQFVENARKLLKDLNIKAYSESEIKGVKNTKDNESDNWFAQKHLADNSHILFTIVSEEEADKVLTTIKQNNESKGSLIHAFQMNIEKAVM